MARAKKPPTAKKSGGCSSHYYAAAAIVAAFASVFALGSFGLWKSTTRNPFAGVTLIMPSTSDTGEQRDSWVRQLAAHARCLNRTTGESSVAAPNTAEPAAPDAVEREALASTPEGVAQQLLRLEGRQAKVATVVVRTDKGLGLFYAGAAPLPKGAIVSLYRCSLFVRHDLMDEWAKTGAMAADEATVHFWAAHAIRLQPKQADEPSWSCFPVGEEATAGAAREAWYPPFGWGPLDKTRVTAALKAHAALQLADWSAGRRWIHPHKDDYYAMSAHVMNEPSADEAPNVYTRRPAPCSAFGVEESGSSIRVCSTVITAHASREIQPGDELTWCYGGRYRRTGYVVSKACVE